MSADHDRFTNRVRFLRAQAEHVELEGFVGLTTPRWVANVLREDAALLTSSVSELTQIEGERAEAQAAYVANVNQEYRARLAAEAQVASLREALGVFRPYADVFENTTLTDIEFGRLRDKLDPLLRAAARASREEGT